MNGNRAGGHYVARQAAQVPLASESGNRGDRGCGQAHHLSTRVRYEGQSVGLDKPIPRTLLMWLTRCQMRWSTWWWTRRLTRWKTCDWQFVILMEIILEVVMGMMYMNFDKVSNMMMVAKFATNANGAPQGQRMLVVSIYLSWWLWWMMRLWLFTMSERAMLQTRRFELVHKFWFL